MAQKDERVKIMNEILSGIKVIIHGTVRYLPPSFLRFCPNRMSLQTTPATSETKIVFRLVLLDLPTFTVSFSVLAFVILKCHTFLGLCFQDFSFSR